MNDEKALVEITGSIKSVLNYNNVVEIELFINDELVKIEIPRKHCSPKKLSANDIIRICGNICDYTDENKKYKYSVTFANAVVHRLLKANNVNNKADFTGDFSLLGYIGFSELIKDEEFYKIDFRLVETDEIHTVYVLKDIFENAMNEYDFRRLIHISGKCVTTEYHKYYMDVPISKIQYFATKFKFI